MPSLDINRPRFIRLSREACAAAHERFNIGTYKEKTLHRVLKNYFELNPAFQEIPFEGFIADVQNDAGIIEIQTSGFASMRDKLEAFLPLQPVTLVYPIPKIKWISWIEPDSGQIGQRHRSPKVGKLFDAVPEMVFIHEYLTHPNLTVRAVLIEVDEYRMLNGRRSRTRKRGSTRFERMPIDLFEIYDFRGAGDYAALIPFDREAEFTAKELSAVMKYRGRDVSAMIKVLMGVGAIERLGKRGNAYVYRIAENVPFANK